MKKAIMIILIGLCLSNIGCVTAQQKEEDRIALINRNIVMAQQRAEEKKNGYVYNPEQIVIIPDSIPTVTIGSIKKYGTLTCKIGPRFKKVTPILIFEGENGIDRVHIYFSKAKLRRLVKMAQVAFEKYKTINASFETSYKIGTIKEIWGGEITMMANAGGTVNGVSISARGEYGVHFVILFIKTQTDLDDFVNIIENTHNSF